MLGFKKILLSVGLLSLTGAALAQNPPPPTITPAQAPVGPIFPSSGSVQPSIDAASNAYLPWLGQNLMNLVAYEELFWKLQQSDVSGGSSAYNATGTAYANTQLVNTLQTTLQSSVGITETNMQTMLAFGSSPPSAATTALAMLPGTDNTPPNNNKQPASDNAFLNADTILGVFNYDPTNSTAAAAVNNLVMFLTGQAQPIGILSFNPATVATQMGQADVQNYLLEARAAAAAQSVAMSNLQYLAQERALVKGLGTNAHMTTLPLDTNTPQTPINDASQLQLEQFLVDRRVGNPLWYANVNTASSTAVQRETLFVLAEISKQMFEQKLLLERMLAEEVAMQQSTSQINQAKINYDYQTVQSSLSATAASASSSGTSGGTGGTGGGTGTGGFALTPAQQAAMNAAQGGSGGTTLTPAQQAQLNKATGGST
ncbi:MAG TPA: hypothetical protein VGV92_02220 [Gammaproteobacteria bacterium]|nr:hypothetical protein [Gammaproteobacteria bacterium]